MPTNDAVARIIAAMQAGTQAGQSILESRRTRTLSELTEEQLRQLKALFPLLQRQQQAATTGAELDPSRILSLILKESEGGGKVPVPGAEPIEILGQKRRRQIDVEMAGEEAQARRGGELNAELAAADRLVQSQIDKTIQLLERAGLKRDTPEFETEFARQFKIEQTVPLSSVLRSFGIESDINTPIDAKTASQLAARLGVAKIAGASRITVAGMTGTRFSASQENDIAAYNAVEQQLQGVLNTVVFNPKSSVVFNPKLLRFIGPRLATGGGFGGMREAIEARTGGLTEQEAIALNQLRQQLAEARKQFFGTALSENEKALFEKAFPNPESMTAVQFVAALKAMISNLQTKRNELIKAAQQPSGFNITIRGQGDLNGIIENE